MVTEGDCAWAGGIMANPVTAATIAAESEMPKEKCGRGAFMLRSSKV